MARVDEKHGLEKPDIGRWKSALKTGHPKVKKPAEKPPVFLRRGRECGCATRIIGIGLDTGNELEMRETDFFEGLINLLRELNRVIIDDSYGVNVDTRIEKEEGAVPDGSK